MTAAVAQTGYYEIQFMLANNFWGCNFNFGNAACGIQIRQGVAHMIDKTSFTNNELSIKGVSTPIDNPVPTNSAGSLPSPNSCGYDTSFLQSGSQCVVGSVGGTAYHLAASAGADGFPWLQAPGSSDLNAAAQHFVNAGLATGFNPSTSVLTGINPAAAANPVNIFIRNDDVARLDIGNSLEAQICYLFTGSYAFPCSYMFHTSGPVTAFQGFTTSTTSVNLNWWMYTAAYSYVPFFDDSLYHAYNSRLVSGISSIQLPSGTCSMQAVPTSSAPDYMYLCNPTYDSLSSRMEGAPCLSAPGDPSPGSTNNGPGANCPNTTQLSAISAGIQAEAAFGAGAFTVPIFQRTVQFGYLNNGWVRAINNADAGLPNYFTWLNTYNPTPPQSGTIRQGFSQSTRSVNPYIASTPQELYIVNNVYDSLFVANPLSPVQPIYWMTSSSFQFPNNNNLGYTPPPNTATTYRFTLRPLNFFQDGTPVTVYDVAFSYLSMAMAGASLGTGASTMTGITILSSTQFDLNVNSLSPFVLPNLTTIPILPARYWTNAGSSAWDMAMTNISSECRDSILTTSICFPTQFTLNISSGTPPSVVVCTVSCGFPPILPAALMTVNPADLSATFDPIANHIMVGSGAWTCGTVTSTGSGTCTPSGTQNPTAGQSYTLTRFGNGLAPASSLIGIYFRSAGNLALYLWSNNNGDITHDFTNFAVVANCFGRPVGLSGPCARWQQGIGNPGTGTMIAITQVVIVLRYFGVNWISPFNWPTAPPLGIGAQPPILYEGSVTLNPASVVGCPSGYDC
jgi:hypothetical protein